jgi:hypothetical protein
MKTPLREISGKHRICSSSLDRHKSHVSQAIEKVSEKREETLGNNILGEMHRVQRKAWELLAAPFLRDRVMELSDWSDVKLLTIRADSLRKWYRPGLVCIGDAAHAMSPVGGVGINLAIQDAVASANILVDVRALPDARCPLRSERRCRVLRASGKAVSTWPLAIAVDAGAMEIQLWEGATPPVRAAASDSFWSTLAAFARYGSSQPPEIPGNEATSTFT